MVEEPRNVTAEELDFEEYRKRPVVIGAVQMDEPFTVDTLEGDDQHGDTGDYLVQGVEGERYPVDEAIFEQTYDPVEPDDEPHSNVTHEFVEIPWDGELAGDIADAVVEGLTGEYKRFDRQDVELLLQKIHIEVNTEPRLNGAEVAIVEEPESFCEADEDAGSGE